MNFLYKYYIEIKNRIILLLFTWCFTLAICYFYKEMILFKVINSTHKLYGSSILKPYFIFTDVSEIFYVYFKLIIFVSNQVIFLNFFYHLLMFLALGLYRFEYLKFRNILIFFILSFFISLFFLFSTLLPSIWNFFLHFQENNSYSISFVSFFFEAKIFEYLLFFIDLYYACFFSCQFFLVIIFLINYLSIELNNIKTFRKLFYLSFVVFSTLITPPDVFSQLILSFCFISIYEILIFCKCFIDIFNKEAN